MQVVKFVRVYIHDCSFAPYKSYRAKNFFLFDSSFVKVMLKVITSGLTGEAMAQPIEEITEQARRGMAHKQEVIDERGRYRSVHERLNIQTDSVEYPRSSRM